MTRSQRKKFGFPLTMISLLSLLLFGFGCSGGGSSGGSSGGSDTGATVSGLAAAGAPIVGTINVRGADGNMSFSAIQADGSFTVDVAALTPPFVLWAEGTANGKSVKLYSTVDGPGDVNVTPATHMIMAMALGDDPDTYYTDDSDAAAPDAQNIDGAKQEILDRLESVFATLGLPDDFDLMNGDFVVDGTGFDQVLDTVDMISDPDTKTVALVDKVSGAELYKENVETDVVETDLTPEEIDNIVSGSITDAEAMNALIETIETLYATSKPTLAELQQQLRPLMADDFLEDGYGPDDTLLSWDDPTEEDEGPTVGMKIDRVAVHRPMQEFTVGTISPLTINEKGNNYDGVWVVVKISEEDGFTEEFITSFVQATDGDSWKWYGNRNPFLDGGDIEAKAVRHISPENPAGEIFSGLGVYTNDVGNLALTNFGIDFFVIVNGALPPFPASGGDTYTALAMGKNDPIDTRYSIQNYPDLEAALWDHLFTEADGLNIDNLHDQEFYFVGFNSADLTTPLHVWMDLVGMKPEKSSGLTANDFPVITSPSSFDPSDLGIPGDVTVTWTVPAEQEADWLSLGWGNNQDWTMMDVDAEDDPALDFADRTSYTFDTSDTLVLPATNAWVNLGSYDQYDRSFTTEFQMYLLQ
jgi:hypothetical protein